MPEARYSLITATDESNQRITVERNKTRSWLAPLLCLSLVLNLLQGFDVVNLQRHVHRQPGVSESKSFYANIQENIPTPYQHKTPYVSENRTVQDAAWESSDFDPTLSLVAISDDWSQAKGLPASQRWPWDRKKGLYFINAMHNLHCVQFFRTSITEAFDGKNQTLDRGHLEHCLDIIRDDIKCNADDTLRYTGRVNSQAGAEKPFSGIGQQRMCRSWDQLVEWSKRHSACYKPIAPTGDGFRERERYKFCPDGSVHW